MVIIESVQISMIVLIGCYATISDLKTGLIKNKVLLPAISVGIILSALYYGLFYRALFQTYLANVAILVLVIAVLFLTHSWAGGDCKLMLTIALLYPSRHYVQNDAIPYSLFLIPVFAFLFGYLYLIIDSIIYGITQKTFISWKSLYHGLINFMLQFLRTLIYIFALNLIYTNFVLPWLSLNSILLAILFIFSAIAVSSFRVFQSKLLLFCTLVFDIALSILTRTVPSIASWMSYAVVLLSVLLRLVMSKYNYKKIPTANLRKGMILSLGTSLLLHNAPYQGLPPISTEDLRSRITKEEVEQIHAWATSKFGQSSVLIVRKIPFAIFIFLGTVAFYCLGVFYQ